MHRRFEDKKKNETIKVLSEDKRIFYNLRVGKALLRLQMLKKTIKAKATQTQ